MTKTKKRIFYFDEIRALAILFVILIHVSKWFAAAETPQSLYWCFSSFLAALGNIGVPKIFKDFYTICFLDINHHDF